MRERIFIFKTVMQLIIILIIITKTKERVRERIFIFKTVMQLIIILIIITTSWG